MKLVCYIKEGQEQLAILSGNTLYDMDGLHPELPSSMSMFLNYWDDYLPLAKNINKSIQQGKISLNQGMPLESVTLISPVPLPASCRKVLSTEVDSGEPVTDATSYRKFPSFHFTNHHSVQGPGEVSCMPDHMEGLQFNMGIAIVVSSHGRNFTAEEADGYIAGYMICNEISVPGQPVNKEIATVFGPWLVTPDELEPYITTSPDSQTGSRFHMPVKCSVNGETLITPDMADLQFTFSEMLESCAYGAGLQPGDIIFTQLPITGGYPEKDDLADTGKSSSLHTGDIITIETELLGISTITITADDSDFSLYNPL